MEHKLLVAFGENTEESLMLTLFRAVEVVLCVKPLWRRGSATPGRDQGETIERLWVQGGGLVI